MGVYLYYNLIKLGISITYFSELIPKLTYKGFALINIEDLQAHTLNRVTSELTDISKY